MFPNKKKMKLLLILGFFIYFQMHSNVLANEYGKFKPSSFSNDNEVVLFRWNSEEGIVRFSRAKLKEDFYQLAHNFQPQINPLFCGIATSVIILNTMRIPKNLVPSQTLLEVETPEVWGGKRIKFPSYSQLTFLNDETDKIKTRKLIELKNVTENNTNDALQFDPGLTILQLKKILEAYDTQVESYYADMSLKKGVKIFRKHIKSILAENKRFLVVNFYGETIGTITKGHISPIAAYDEQTDSVLILDVAIHKNPWYWVPVRHLYQAMNTKDGNNFRGWLIIQDSIKING